MSRIDNRKLISSSGKIYRLNGELDVEGMLLNGTVLPVYFFSSDQRSLTHLALVLQNFLSNSVISFKMGSHRTGTS
jgi:hypothetical protein